MAIPTNPSLNEEWTNDATGITYTWNGERWIIKSGEASGDFVEQDVFEADQKRQDDDIEAGFDTQGSILIKNIEQDQTLGVHSGQINALETQVQLLAGVRAVGRWTYRRRVESNSPRPPADSCFYGTHKDDISTILRNWSDINLLMINKTDLDGNTFAFSQFEEGDKVEVIASDGSSAVYGTVTNNPSNDVYANMILAVERSNGGPVEEKEYLISAYRPGSSNGNVDLDILDGRYLVKTGDEMSGVLEIHDPGRFKMMNGDGEETYKIFPSGVLETKNEIRIDRSGTQQCLVIKKDGTPRINMTADGYTSFFDNGGLKFMEGGQKLSVLYRASDSITQWTAYNGNGIKITARDGDPGNGRTYIDIKTVDSNGTQGDDDGYRMKLFHVATPTDDFHGVNKKYVDDSIEDIIIPGHNNKRPPGLRFMYESGSGSVSSGKFKWYSDSGRKLRISATSQDFPWGTNSPVGDISYSESHLFHIWATTTSNSGVTEWKVKTSGSFNRMDWHSNDILLYVPYNLMNGDFSTTAAYYISISGLF